jgi:predicted transcriptional regulator
MTTLISISAEAKAAADEMIRNGEVTSFDQLVRAALRHDPDGWIDEPLDLDSLSAEDRAAVEQGLADVAAGRVYPAEQVFAELRARFDVPTQ